MQDSNKIDAMYVVQMALEVALNKNSMMSSKLNVYGKSPRLFYLDTDRRQPPDYLADHWKERIMK